MIVDQLFVKRQEISDTLVALTDSEYDMTQMYLQSLDRLQGVQDGLTAAGLQIISFVSLALSLAYPNPYPNSNLKCNPRCRFAGPSRR